MAVPPTADMPIPKPTRPCSLMGMLSTRSEPNSSSSPCVQRNTPPNPTSSPNTTACGFVWSSILIASLMAVNIFICFVSPSMPGRVHSPRLNPRSAGRRSALTDRDGRAHILCSRPEAGSRGGTLRGGHAADVSAVSGPSGKFLFQEELEHIRPALAAVPHRRQRA